MAGNINLFPCSCSFRLYSTSDDDQEPNLRSKSFSQDSFNSSFSSKTSFPSLISTLIQPTTTLHHECISTFKTTSSQILSLTVAGNHLISGSSTHIHLLPSQPTATDYNNLNSIPCRTAVKSLQMLNENILISAHQDHKIRIWKINNLNFVLPGHYQWPGSTKDAHVSPQLISCGSMSRLGHVSDNICPLKIVTILPTLKDRLTKILFAKNYVEIRRHKKLTWIHHNDAVSSLAVSSNKTLIYSASWDRSFKIWRISDFKCLESVSNAHDDAISAILSSDEGFVYTGSADKKIKVWKFNEKHKKHDLIDSLLHHKSSVNALTYDDNSCVLISGACSGVMIASERDFSGNGGHMVVMGALLGHKKAILSVKIVGELVCSGSADKTMRLWRRAAAKSYTCLSVLEGHGGPVKCLTVVEENSGEDDYGKGYMVYSGSLDGEIKVWKVWVPNVNC
ncbi:protein JINGUBANG-like [Rutidosis leptorrhynchoides]|uniref:protein JINGUBANG-like n=1 Tax=Rutidosis leptorrhynchoides TaxID=125765 RepID=UPI003A99DC64